MINFDNFSEKITKNINLYWSGFKLVAYALYDKEKVYLYNHPAFLSQSKPYHVFQWNEQFNGASTLILYKDYPTAIINLEFHHDLESIYSEVVHELFHGFQYLQGEKRFPDEKLGMTYPLLEENVEIRNRERNYLYNAVLSPSNEEKLSNLNKFINLREKRHDLIDEFMDYEVSIETVEGPAFYVELRAFSHISPQTYDAVLNRYSQSLIDKRDSAFNLRKSCYSSGLFICLLLDDIQPNWKETLFESDELLYDILKKAIKWEPNHQINNMEISKETISIVNAIKENKKDLFNQFEQMDGHHFYIIGNMISKAFDPMNIIADEYKLLHKNFMTLLINNSEYHCSRPVIAYYNDKYKTINKLHLVLDERPVYKNGIVNIKDLGEIQGHYYEDEGTHYINC